jgi:S1-C subfamily serine protease
VNRRAALAAGVAVVVLCTAALATLAVTSRAGHPAGRGATPAPTGRATTAADAVVNINGVLPGGGIAGTGMVIAADGIVLTNNHVVQGTESLTGQIAGAGPVYQATVLGVDPTDDVAVVRLEGARGLRTVPLDTNGVVTAGDQVTGIGNALGADGAPVPATGAVTALNETLTVAGESPGIYETLNGLIGISAAIQPGDSGGPLLNSAGDVIGMDTAGVRGASVPINGSLGDAIPITRALSVAHDILSGVTSPYIQSGHSGILGVSAADITGVDGAAVTSVTPGDAAATAGIVGGDVITSIDGVAIHSHADLTAVRAGRRPGDTVTVVWRDPTGASHRASIALSPGPPA